MRNCAQSCPQTLMSALKDVRQDAVARRARTVWVGLWDSGEVDGDRPF